MKFGNPWNAFRHAMCHPNDVITRPTKWAIPLLLTGCGTICMVASFSLPAASMESFRLAETDPIRYVDWSGGGLFIVSILFGISHPAYFVYSAMNILFFPLALAMLRRPSFRYLRRSGYLMLFFACVAFTGFGTVQRYLGWWLWWLSFLLVGAGRFWPLFFGRRDTETFHYTPFSWLPGFRSIALEQTPEYFQSES